MIRVAAATLRTSSIEPDGRVFFFCEQPALCIDAADVISDSGSEIYSFLRERGIHTLLVMGVHTNMCILNRTLAIERMTALGIRCILVRDLTDAM